MANCSMKRQGVRGSSYPGALSGRDPQREFGAVRDGADLMGSALAWSAQLRIRRVRFAGCIREGAIEALANNVALRDRVAARAGEAGGRPDGVAPLGEGSATVRRRARRGCGRARLRASANYSSSRRCGAGRARGARASRRQAVRRALDGWKGLDHSRGDARRGTASGS
jgi:hypothetical protein